MRCALEKVGFDSRIISTKSQLKNADAIVLPGVGNFTAALKNLASIKNEILELVSGGMPILGICLGMQLFFPRSEEGAGRGLAVFEGENIQLPSSVKVPHMGWNTVRIVEKNELLEDLQDESYVYFVHSYYPAPADEDIVCAETTYGTTFPSAIVKQNIFGTQFHPEKSGETGLKILNNFVKIAKR